MISAQQQALRQTTLGLAPRKTVRVERRDSEATIQILSGHPYLHDLSADNFERLFQIKERKPGCSTFIVTPKTDPKKKEKRRFLVNTCDIWGRRFAHIDASDPGEHVDEQARLQNHRFELSYDHPKLETVRLVTQSAATNHLLKRLVYARPSDPSLVKWCEKIAAANQGMICRLTDDPTLACIVSPFDFLDGSDGEMYPQKGFLVSTPQFSRAPKRR